MFLFTYRPRVPLASLVVTAFVAAGLSVGTVGATTLSASAAPVATVFNADPATLGAIPDGPAVDGNCLPTAQQGIRDVKIPVSGVTTPTLSKVAVSITMRHDAVGDLVVVLFSPDGRPVRLMDRTGRSAQALCGDASGFGSVAAGADARVAFNDTNSASLRATMASIDADQYISQGYFYPETQAGARSSMTAPLASLGAAANGVWTLRFLDSRSGNTGSVSAAGIQITTDASTTAPAPAPPKSACAKATKRLSSARASVKAVRTSISEFGTVLKKARRSHNKKQVRRYEVRIKLFKTYLAKDRQQLRTAKKSYKSACGS